MAAENFVSLRPEPEISGGISRGAGHKVPWEWFLVVNVSLKVLSVLCAFETDSQ